MREKKKKSDNVASIIFRTLCKWTVGKPNTRDSPHVGLEPVFPGPRSMKTSNTADVYCLLMFTIAEVIIT